MYQRAENLIRRLSLGRKAKYNFKMLNRVNYENDLIALGIDDIEEQQDILNQLYVYATVINEMYNNQLLSV